MFVCTMKCSTIIPMSFKKSVWVTASLPKSWQHVQSPGSSKMSLKRMIRGIVGFARQRTLTSPLHKCWIKVNIYSPVHDGEWWHLHLIKKSRKWRNTNNYQNLSMTNNKWWDCSCITVINYHHTSAVFYPPHSWNIAEKA